MWFPDWHRNSWRWEDCHNVRPLTLNWYPRSIAIDELESKSESDNFGIAYAYFDYKDQDQQSTLRILASLLKQLASQLDNIIPLLYVYQKTLRSRSKQPELHHHIQALNAAATLFSSTFIILDALDECEVDQRKLLLDAISRLEGVRVFTTSRPYLRDLEVFFQCAAHIPIRADTLDIQNFLTQKVDERISQYCHLKWKIVETLSISAQGV